MPCDVNSFQVSTVIGSANSVHKPNLRKLTCLQLAFGVFSYPNHLDVNGSRIFAASVVGKGSKVGVHRSRLVQGGGRKGVDEGVGWWWCNPVRRGRGQNLNNHYDLDVIQGIIIYTSAVS
jgi:hypothetical protein